MPGCVRDLSNVSAPRRRLAAGQPPSRLLHPLPLQTDEPPRGDSRGIVSRRRGALMGLPGCVRDVNEKSGRFFLLAAARQRRKARNGGVLEIDVHTIRFAFGYVIGVVLAIIVVAVYDRLS